MSHIKIIITRMEAQVITKINVPPIFRFCLIRRQYLTITSKK